MPAAATLRARVRRDIVDAHVPGREVLSVGLGELDCDNPLDTAVRLVRDVPTPPSIAAAIGARRARLRGAAAGREAWLRRCDAVVTEG